MHRYTHPKYNTPHHKPYILHSLLCTLHLSSRKDCFTRCKKLAKARTLNSKTCPAKILAVHGICHIEQRLEGNLFFRVTFSNRCVLTCHVLQPLRLDVSRPPNRCILTGHVPECRCSLCGKAFAASTRKSRGRAPSVSETT